MSAISRVQLAIAVALVAIVGGVVLVLGIPSVDAQPPLNNGGGWTSYPDLNENTGISGQRANGEIIATPDPWNSLADIAAAFSNARVIENADLCPGGVCETNATVMSTTVNFPAGYSGWSSSEKALWLLNSEREARGLLPFTGTDAAVEQVAQAWAQNLADNGTFAHNGNRLAEIHAACTGCTGEVGNFPAENLASRSRLSYPNPAVLDGFGVEAAIYNWMYEDRDGGGQFSDQFWGHRHALLWNNLSDDNGSTGTEGFIGIGVAKVAISQQSGGLTFQGEREIVVWNAVDSTNAYPAAPAVPATPTMTAPTGSGTSTTPAFTWSDDGTATGFRVWINDRTNGGLFHDAIYTTAQAGCSGGTCSFTPAGLSHSPNTAYRVWVQAQNAVGNSAWSTSLSYDTYATTAPGTPVIMGPTGSTTTTPTLSWTQESTATSYRIWMNDVTNGGTVLNTVVQATDISCDGGLCSLAPANLTLFSNARYRFWIQAQNFAGRSSWSTSQNFDTNSTVAPGATTLVGPSGNVEPALPFEWNAVPEASWYYLWVNDDTGTPVKTWVSAADAGCSTGQATCSFVVLTSFAGEATWWVRTWNSVSWGPWSSSLTFTSAL